MVYLGSRQPLAATEVRWAVAGSGAGRLSQETLDMGEERGGVKEEFQVSLIPKLAIPPSNTLTTQSPFKTHVSQPQNHMRPPKTF